MNSFIGVHRLAHVEDSVIKKGTKVWQFASVIRKARIGYDCTVGSGATIDGAIIGDRCIVCPGAFVVPGVHIGHDCFIGPNVTFCNDLWPEVGKDGFDLEEIRQKTIVNIDNKVSIGANAVILPGVVIGEGAFVAAGSVVNRDVPSGYMWRGDNQLIPFKDMKHRRVRECFMS